MIVRDKQNPDRLYEIIDNSNEKHIKLKRLNPPSNYTTQGISMPLKTLQTYFEEVLEENI